MKRKLVKKKFKKKKRGFTLIELLAVILILGIIALIAIPTVNSVVRQARIGATESSATNLVSAAEQKCQMAMMKGESFSGRYDISELSDVVKGSDDLKGYFEVSSSCEVQLVLIADNLQDFCYKKSYDDDRVVHYEMEQGETCLLEQKKPSELNCFDYESNGDEITITGYKCGGILTGLSVDEEAGTYDFTYNEGSSMDVVIPGYIDGKKVTKIRQLAFSLSKSLDLQNPDIDYTKPVLIHSVVVPNTIKEIEMGAFAGNIIKSVTLTDGIEKIGYAAFANNSIESLFLPNSVNELAPMAFLGNQIQTLSLSDKLTSISNYTFDNNKITSITIGDKVKTIGERAFSSNNVTNVKLGSSLETIGSYSFSNNHIQSLDIPDSVKVVGKGAFYRNNMSKIIIGKNVETLESHCLKNGDTGEEVLVTKNIVNKTGKIFNWDSVLYGFEGTGFIFETGDIHGIQITKE